MNNSSKTVLIADNEYIDRKAIREHLDRQKDFKVIGECCNGYETIKSVNILEPDILFLDININNINDSEVITKIKHNPLIVFTATNDSFALKAFENDAVDYLLKPYKEERIENTLKKISLKIRKKPLEMTWQGIPRFPSNLFVGSGNRFRKIAVSEIHYLKAAKDYTIVYTSSGEYLSSLGIGCIEESLDPLTFRRVHRSFIVNLNYVSELYSEFGKRYLIMENGFEMSIGKYYGSNLKPLII